MFIGQEAARRFWCVINQGQDRIRFEHKMSHDEVINTLAYVDAGYFSLDKKINRDTFQEKYWHIYGGRPVFGSTGVDAPIAEMLTRTAWALPTQEYKRYFTRF